MYVRIGRKKSEVHEVDKDTLEVRSILHLETGQPGPVEPKSAVFTDSNQLGLILLSSLVSFFFNILFLAKLLVSKFHKNESHCHLYSKAK